MTEKFKVGYYDENGKRIYPKIMDPREEAIALASVMLATSDNVTINRVKRISLDD